MSEKPERVRLRELLNSASLGDEQPTGLLRRMEQLLDGKLLDASIMQELLVQRLPLAEKAIESTETPIKKMQRQCRRRCLI